MASQHRFLGQVALVTGASRGIGRVIARAFAEEGAAVALVSTNGAALRAVRDELGARGGRCLPLVGDVADEADVQRVVAQAGSTLGPIEILVNNAGIPGPTAPATEISFADWQRVLAVNLSGPFLCSREVLRGMIARGHGATKAAGRIVNIGSVAGKIGYPQRSPYASAKWGLIGLTMTLAQEAGPFGIRVNCVCPGPVEGELIEAVIAARARALALPIEKVREQYLESTALKRMVRLDDVAAAVLFLASDAAVNITGQAVDVSAGFSYVHL